MVNENASLVKYEPPKCDECGRKIVVLSDLCAKCAAGIELNGKKQANRPGTNPLPTWPKPPAPPNPPPAPTNLLGLLKGAFDWIESAPHGDNCFVSDHYEGDPGNRCNCGKDSLLSAYEDLGQPEAQAVCQTCNGQGQIGGPSYREPDEGGEPCPDCNQATPAVAQEPTRLDDDDLTKIYMRFVGHEGLYPRLFEDIAGCVMTAMFEKSPAPAVAVNERVGVIERYGYQALFNAIAEATKVEGGAIGVSVLDFAKSLEAATAAAEQMKGGV